jgi:hypothetical protein
VNSDKVKAVKFICPVCDFPVYMYFDELQKTYGFNGHNFNKLPKIGCHICHRSFAIAREVIDIEDFCVDPLEIWIENPH